MATTREFKKRVEELIEEAREMETALNDLKRLAGNTQATPTRAASVMVTSVSVTLWVVGIIAALVACSVLIDPPETFLELWGVSIASFVLLVIVSLCAALLWRNASEN